MKFLQKDQYYQCICSVGNNKDPSEIMIMQAKRIDGNTLTTHHIRVMGQELKRKID